VLFTTQTLGLNPEILEPNDIERLNDRFDIFKIKMLRIFFYGAGCGTDRMKIRFSQAFQNILRTQLFQLKRIPCSCLCNYT
jgi:hypothetical protein